MPNRRRPSPLRDRAVRNRTLAATDAAPARAARITDRPGSESTVPANVGKPARPANTAQPVKSTQRAPPATNEDRIGTGSARSLLLTLLGEFVLPTREPT